MDRIWQWTWDRYKTRYLWALCVAAIPVMLAVYLPLSFLVIAFEESGRYLEAAAITAAAIPVLGCITVLPSRRSIRPFQRWAAGDEVDRLTALEGTYHYLRAAGFRAVWAACVWAAVLAAAVGAISGATGWRVVQYGILGAVYGTGVQLIAFHSMMESAWRPAKLALSGDTGIGDSLPRSRPTFAGRSNLSMVAVAFVSAVMGASLGAVVDRARDAPVLTVVIGFALALGLAVADQRRHGVLTIHAAHP